MLTLTHVEILLTVIMFSQILCFYMIYKINKRFDEQSKVLQDTLSNINHALEKSNEYLLVIAKKNGYL